MSTVSEASYLLEGLYMLTQPVYQHWLLETEEPYRIFWAAIHLTKSQWISAGLIMNGIEAPHYFSLNEKKITTLYIYLYSIFIAE